MCPYINRSSVKGYNKVGLRRTTYITIDVFCPLQDVLKECVTPVADSVKHLVDTAPSGSATPIHKMVKAVESGLSYQFHSVWGLVLQIYTVFFEVYTTLIQY